MLGANSVHAKECFAGNFIGADFGIAVADSPSHIPQNAPRRRRPELMSGREESEATQSGGVPRITVCVGAVVLRDQRILFVRQTYGGLKGEWSLPWGFVDGRRPDGSLEAPDQAAIREIREEAGVAAEIQGLLGVQNHSNRDGDLWLYLIYLCRHLEGEPAPDEHETDAARYFSMEEMERFPEPFDEFCAWVAQRVLRGENALIPPEPENPYRPHLAFL